MASNASHLKIDRFHSALEAAELFRTLGFAWEIVQLSAGPLNGVLKIRRSIDTVCLSLQCNRSMLFHGGGNIAYVPFCLEMNDAFQHRVRGEPLIPFGLYGFHLNLTDVFFQTEAGAHFGVILIPRNRIQQLGALDPTGVLMESISISNNIQLSPELFQTWIQMLEGVFNDHAFGGIDTDQMNALLLESFEPSGLDAISPLPSFTYRCGIVRDLVRWGVENNRQPISLDVLCRTIFSSRSTISQSCREQIGLGAMALLKQIRLQQVQHVLRHREQRQLLACDTVHEVANHFGFHSRSHFARDYRNLFGEAPRQTLARSAV